MKVIKVKFIMDKEEEKLKKELQNYDSFEGFGTIFWGFIAMIVAIVGIIIAIII